MKIVAFAHQKGGVGKSTLAFNTAAYLELFAHKKTILVDLDVQATATNLNYLRQVNKTTPICVEQIADENRLVEIARGGKYDYMIIDAGGFDAGLNRVAIAIADEIIVPATTKITEIFGLGKFAEILEEIESKTKSDIRAKVVLNNLHPSTKDIQIIRDLCRESPRLVLAKSVVKSRAALPSAMALGLCIFEQKDEKAKKEMLDLIKEIVL